MNESTSNLPITGPTTVGGSRGVESGVGGSFPWPSTTLSPIVLTKEPAVPPPAPSSMRRSERIAELAAALAKAQGAITGAKKDRVNTFHNNSPYATLNAIWDACRKALSDNELAVIQSTDARPGPEGTVGWLVSVETTLIHKTGEWVASVLTVPAFFKDRDQGIKVDPQVVGSALTYARKYGLASIAGVAPDEDDDANGATNRGAKAADLAAPEGFDDWAADLAILAAEQGTAALRKAWDASAPERCAYMTRVNNREWEKLKTLAATTTKAQKAGAANG